VYVLYGREALSLTLKEENRARVFENRVLRRIFGPKREKAVGDWRRLHNEELHNLYVSPNIIRVMKSRVMRLAAHVARMVEMRNAYGMLCGRPRCGWKDNIRLDLREDECEVAAASR
jgi:hypothetical protein